MIYNVTIEVKSPLHLGSGRGAVVLDAEVIHDKYGLPYLPAKRLKGALYESALEVWEMAKVGGKECFKREDLEKLFGKIQDKVQLIIHDLHLPDYDQQCKAWDYLQKKYSDILDAEDVLRTYTHIRYQTSIDKKTGVTMDHSLHNLRVVDAGIKFEGEIELINPTDEYLKIIALALLNLRALGAKRNRGFGKVKCSADAKLEKMAYKALLGGTKQ